MLITNTTKQYNSISPVEWKVKTFIKSSTISSIKNQLYQHPLLRDKVASEIKDIVLVFVNSTSFYNSVVPMGVIDLEIEVTY